MLTDACGQEREDDKSLCVLAQSEQGRVGLVADFEGRVRYAHCLDTSDNPYNRKNHCMAAR